VRRCPLASCPPDPPYAWIFLPLTRLLHPEPPGLKGALIRFTSMSGAFGCGSREAWPRASVPHSPLVAFEWAALQSPGMAPRELSERCSEFARPDGPEGPAGADAPNGSPTDLGRNQIVDSPGQRLYLKNCTLQPRAVTARIR
jgi:hypothetical protein